MTAPIASGWSESPGGPSTHWKAPPCHGAHPLPTFRTGCEFYARKYLNIIGDLMDTGVGA
jgi:hypothetical protein